MNNDVSGEEFDKEHGIEHTIEGELPFSIWYIDHKIVAITDSADEDAELLEQYSHLDNEVSVMPCRNADPMQVMLTMQEEMAKRLHSTYSSQYTMNHILYAEAEMHEFLREIEGFKEWKSYNWDETQKAHHLDNAKEEFVDILHFLWNVANSIGLTADELTNRFVQKNIINHKRQDYSY